jgi:hypothetical protein
MSGWDEQDTDIDVSVKQDLDQEVELETEIDKDEKVEVDIDVDPDVNDNSAIVNFDIKAVADDKDDGTFTELDLFVLTTNFSSSIAGTAISVVDD